MKGIMCLSELAPHAAARVVRVEQSGLMARLMGLGLTKGAEVVRLFSAPGGDPTAYFLRGTTVALRKKDADRVLVSSREDVWD